MDNKGFTLIELLVTISLLAVIAIISFVSINAVIEKNKVSNCEILVENIKSAAKLYVSDNRYDRTFTELETSIKLSDLISGNYLSGEVGNNPLTDDVISLDSEISIILNKNYTVKEVDVSSFLNCVK